MASRKRPPVRRLRPQELRWTCPADWIPKTTGKEGELSASERLFGQERALDSMEMGLAVQAPGYNVFVCGLGGTDKADVITELLGQMRLECPMPRDHVFVHNFEDPLSPRHLALPPGGAAALAESMSRWVQALRRDLPKILRQDSHLARRQKLFDRYRRAERQLFRRLERRIRPHGLALVTIEDEESGTRHDLHYRLGREKVDPDAVGELPAAERPGADALKRLAEARAKHLPEVDQARQKARALGLRLLREVRMQDEAVVQQLVEDLTLAVAEELGADTGLGAWLGDCASFALNHTELFGKGGERRAGDDGDADGDGGQEDGTASAKRGLEVFEINIVRTFRDEGCPIVFEGHPNYSNLFGTVERRVVRGGAGHVHLAVRPGSLLIADGGYLVLNARDIFKEAEVWRTLKRTLQSGRLAVHALEGHSPLGVTGARPQPIELNLKVVLVGDGALYESLHDEDFDFPHIFKVKAEFEDSLTLNKRNVGRLVRCLRDLGRKEGLPPFASTGLRALVERAVRDADRRNRLSSRLPTLADFAREAAFYAGRAGKRRIDRDAVETARRSFRAQHALDAEEHLRATLENVYQVSTSGTRVGTVNALTVVNLGPLGFGRPTRVSAMMGGGDEAFTSFDREVELAGPIHNKGMMALESYMRHRYGQKRSLPARMSLSFDQSYGPIDGDSASTTELYALLSALSGMPVRQDLAVTGALGMRGEVLAVGGVNDKIEGFYELCRGRGLTGRQGALLPRVNVDDLMLPPEIVRAVQERRFHLWALEEVDQGIALLFDAPAAEVHAAVAARLAELEKEKDDKDEKETGKAEER